jgi:hypothetical protein
LTVLARRQRRASLLVAVALFGVWCARDRAAPNADRVADEATSYAVQRLALDAVFNGREHAQRLVLWSTDAGDGPALEALGSAVAEPRVPRAIDVAKLAPSLPATVMDQAALAKLFRRYPDAWAAFFRAHPGAAGLVELSPVRLSRDGLMAETYVGRSCGEHCRSAWRLTVRRDAGGRWSITDLHFVRLPPV